VFHAPCTIMLALQVPAVRHPSEPELSQAHADAEQVPHQPQRHSNLINGRFCVVERHVHSAGRQYDPRVACLKADPKAISTSLGEVQRHRVGMLFPAVGCLDFTYECRRALRPKFASKARHADQEIRRVMCLDEHPVEALRCLTACE